jgi:shikimate kinase
MHTPPRPIALIGLMGAGKTAVARALGERLAVSVGDLDAMLEAETGRTVAEQFADDGEAEFRRREGLALRRALDAGVRVIACGGGVVLDPANRALLRERCDVVWLEVTPHEAAHRLELALGSRPLLAGGDPETRLSTVLAERTALYRDLSARRVATDGLGVDAVAATVAAGLVGDVR